MKRMTLRSCVAALACALGLAACGGGSSGSLIVGGSVSGLTQDGLVLQNNGGDDYTVTAYSTSFAFSKLIGYDSAYNVTIKTQPANTICTVTNGKGVSSAYNVTSIQVTCLTNNYFIGGTISGLGNATGLILANGADTYPVPAGTTSFRMPEKVSLGAPYGVAVFQQPAGKTCTVNNGSGRMAAADVTNIEVVCQ
ncbi:hypothetical protein [Massilia sp. TS11]|uniref:hypothetical protein n=1 Tax=Massilia sp. TS11 TaxID=2908003 RepID=UPI001EDC1D95|nr:hypothetical protein [Massilia sp. TS11]MCG2586386.1 hypothetical protein [Massilia sp. TS11]